MFQPWLSRWSLTKDGDPIVTASSRLLPVRLGAQVAMLKLTSIEEEKRGGGLMEWWGGDGAAKVLAREGDALLLERAVGAPLSSLSVSGRDDEASATACRTAARRATSPAHAASHLVRGPCACRPDAGRVSGAQRRCGRRIARHAARCHCSPWRHSS